MNICSTEVQIDDIRFFKSLYEGGHHVCCRSWLLDSIFDCNSAILQSSLANHVDCFSAVDSLLHEVLLEENDAKASE